MKNINIHNSKYNNLLLAFFLFAVSTTIWVAGFTNARFEKRDAYDYAQLGLQIRTGEGFTTRQIFPRYIPYLQDQGQLEDKAWPSLHRYPGLPTAVAFFQLFISNPIDASVVATGVFFLLGVPLLFLLAVHLSGIETALLATLLYLGDPRLVRSAYNGMTETLAILLLLMLAHTIFRAPAIQGKRLSWCFAGLLCGLIYLTRTQLVFALPLVILFVVVVVEKHRLRSSLYLLAGVAAVVSPWFARNYAVTGNPLFSFNTTRALLAKAGPFHRIDLVLDAPVDTPAVIELAGQEILHKVFNNLWPSLVNPEFWFQVLGFYSIGILILVIGLFKKRRDSKMLIFFETSVLVFILANFVMVSSTYHRPRYYITLIPFIVIVLSCWIWSMINTGLSKTQSQTKKKLRIAAASILFLFAGYRTYATFLEHRVQAANQPPTEIPYSELARITDRADMIVSDLSLEITVYNGNRTIRLPSNPDDILKIDQNYLRIDYLVISERVAKRDIFRGFLKSERFRRSYQPATRLSNGAHVFRRATP